MAFPTVPTTASNTLLSSTTTTASTTHTFPSLTTLAPAAGDLIIAICVMYTGGTTNAEFSSWGASLTETRDDATTTANDLALGVAHKIASGSESGTFTVTSATAARSVNFLMRIPAATWHGTTIPEVLAAVRATGAVADPGSFDPANWAAEDTLWISVYGHSETSTTGSPPTIDTPPTNYTGQLIVARAADAVGHITAAVAFRQVNASSQDVGTWTVSNANRGNGLAAVVGIRPHEPQTKDLTGPGTETETAQALTFVQGTHSIGGTASETDTAGDIIELQPLPGTETDSAQAVTYEQEGGQNIDITQAAETDSAQALRVPRLTAAAEADASIAQAFDKPIFKTVTQGAETDAAQALTFAQASDYDISQASETDSAGTLRVPRITVALETDSAQTVTTSQSTDYDITLASETDAAQSVDKDKAVTIGVGSETDLANEIVSLRPLPALETDSAQPVTFEFAGATDYDITHASETDAAQAVTYAQASDYDLTHAAETDAAQTLTVSQDTYSITAATETDLANQIVPLQPLPATETDSSETLTFTQDAISITHASETDSSQAVDTDKAVTLPEYEQTPPLPYNTLTIGDTSTAMPLAVASGAHSVTLTPASETDSAQVLTRTKVITHASETDTALTLTYSQAGAFSIAPGLETDTAQALTFTKPIHKTITLAGEVDSAQTATFSQANTYTIGRATEQDAAQTVTFTKTIFKTLTVAAELDEAGGLPYGGAYNITEATETNTAVALRYAPLPPSGTITSTRKGKIRHVTSGSVRRPKQGVLS